MPQFSQRSKDRLASCHPDLRTVFDFIIKYYDITILCGHRGEDEQNAAHAAGNSHLTFPDSKHNKTPSMAVDVAPYPIDWTDIDEFEKLHELVEVVAYAHGIKLRWGGHWPNLRDYVHYEVVIE